MPFFSSLFGPTSMSSGGSGFFNLLGGPKTNAGVQVSEFNAVTLPAVYACVRVISDAISMLPVGVYRQEGDKTKLVKGHPASQLLNIRPNDRMTAFTYRSTSLHHSLLWGNGYSEIERTNGGEPVGLWLALPDRTWPELESDGHLQYQTNIQGNSKTLDASDVCHVPALGFDGVVGYSPVSVARQAIGLGLAMETFGAKFFGNDSKSGGFLKHPGKLTPEAIVRIRAGMDAQSGLDQSHRPKVLEEGMEWIQTTINPEDAQFLESRDFQVADIARIFGVPLHMIQSVSGSTSWGSGLEEMSLGFVRYTLAPWLCRQEQEWSTKLLTERERKEGLYIKHDTHPLLRGDAKARAEYYTKALHPQTGWLQENEVRDMEDRNPVDDPRQPTTAPERGAVTTTER